MKTIKRKSKRELKDEATQILKAAKMLKERSYRQIFAFNTPATAFEQRKLLGVGKRKLISIRIPEDDLEQIQEIAKINGRKYQQLIVQAVEFYIDYYRRRGKTKKEIEEEE